MPDRQLAKLAGVHPVTIFQERKQRNIPPFRPIEEPVRWTPAMIRELGSDTDSAVAAALRIPFSAVGRKRRLLGIPPFVRQAPRRRQPREIDWKPEDLARLGKMSDRALAKKLRISTGSVLGKRQRLGIAPWRARPTRVVWTGKMVKLLGKVADAEIARRFSISADTVTHKRRRLRIPPVMDRRGIERTAKLRQLLHLPPTEVRRRTGLSLTTIWKLTRKLGIRSLRPSQLRYNPEIIARMGKEPDYVIAADIGASDSAVRQKRRALGIPAYEGWRGRPRGGSSLRA